jgi:succinate-semialdehyde dehydrogenase / glutarate-semialdehyde dehydrogenase
MDNKLFTTVNPYNNQKLETYNYLTSDQMFQAVQRAQRAQVKWFQLSIVDRQNYLGRLKLEIAQKKTELALSMSREMGKPLLQSGTEIEKSLQLIEYCLLTAENLFKESRHKHHVIFKNPLGVIYGIMPWNFPIWQTLRFTIPTLLAGNAVLLKPAENVAGTSLILQDAFQKAIDIPGLYTNVFIPHSLSDELIAQPIVRGVSFTGSTRAGKEIAKVAGQFLKKCVLELGGNDAYIICEDADVNLAAQKVYQGRILNSGQSCISAKRIFVHDSIADVFLQNLVGYLKEIQFGDPLLSKNLMGPLARPDLVEHLQNQLNQAVAQGAQVFYQKELPKELKGLNFFPPTILTKVPAQGISHFDEFFGPVFSVIRYKTEEEALALANQSPFGLGGAVFTKNSERAKRVALQMETGSVAINDYLKSAPERPFGGVKNSGYGCELGEAGFFEFTHNKVIVF